MSIPSIKRIAFVQDYRNRPLELANLMPAIAQSGYQAIALAVMEWSESVPVIAAAAEQEGLEFMAFTGHMKYQNAYLMEHPDQRMVLAGERGGEDQDGLSILWGCPFNPDFAARYHSFLRRLTEIPNLTEVWINDEAHLGSRPDAMGCYCVYCQKDWNETFGGEIPRPPFDNPQQRAQFAAWRIKRWNTAHGRMKDVLNETRPIRAVFQASPHNCFHLNPWISGVDLASMTREIDGLMTDPYYTYHLTAGTLDTYQPLELYQSECCRHLRGAVAPGQSAEICAQGFSHPSFLRPLDRRDGWWTGVIPLALGMNAVTAYTYTLQGAAPQVRDAFEESFRLDPWFARTEPLPFAAVIDSLETKCADDGASDRQSSWAFVHLQTLGRVLRQAALPYLYVPSLDLCAETLSRYPVVVLPAVSCLSDSACAALCSYVEAGGLLIACGNTATRDGNGTPKTATFLEDLFGVALEGQPCTSARFEASAEHAAFENLPWPDEITANLQDGMQKPGFSLSQTTRVRAEVTTKVLATFRKDAGDLAGCPALTIRSRGAGQAIYLAGTPTRTFKRPGMSSAALNFAGRVLSNLILEVAGDRLPVRAINYPPVVPLQQVRPMDSRWRPTFEVMPSVGEGLILVTIPSYFQEPATFGLEIDIPAGKTCKAVRELVADIPVTPQQSKAGTVSIEVDLSDQDFLKVFAVELA